MIKRIIISLGIFFTLIVIVVSIGIFLLMRHQDTVLAESIDAIQVATLNDGTYQGEYAGTRWENTVEVTIENGLITEIEIIDDMRLVDDVVSAQLFERIKSSQSLDIDVISGATVTSIAYLKAIEDALHKAK